MILFADLIARCTLALEDFVAKPNHTVMDEERTG